MRPFFFVLTLPLVLCSCSGNSEEDSQLKALESKLEQQEAELNAQKEEMLKKELEAKEQEIERLKEENSQEKNAYPGPAKNNSFSGPAYGYGFYPEASSRQLSPEELSSMTRRELKIMRNEIFARHGYIFKTRDMIDHFSDQPWYEPTYNDVTGMLSKIEKANIALIKSFE
ncbi:MAG: YARHG domain-containing protein [Bacteroidota bacterium]